MTNETTASQPKSIWDDSQFQNAFYDYRRFGNNEFLSKLVEVIDNWADSRAPAAQAAATIQAAPEGYKLVAIEPKPKTCHGNGFNSCCSEACAWKSDQAATIREAVMVAEPVPKIRIALRQALRLVGFFGGHDADVTVAESADGLIAFCTECPEEGSEFLGATEVDDELARIGVAKTPISAHIDLIKAGALRQFRHNDGSPGFVFAYDKSIVDRALAAPMVADPAGVVVDAKFWPQGPTQIACSSCGLTAGESRVLDALKRGEMAATVKAVPSEALLCEVLAFDYELDVVDPDHRDTDGRVGVEFRESYKALRSRIANYFAAPLAGKTGGGE